MPVNLAAVLQQEAIEALPQPTLVVRGPLGTLEARHTSAFLCLVSDTKPVVVSSPTQPQLQLMLEATYASAPTASSLETHLLAMTGRAGAANLHHLLAEAHARDIGTSVRATFTETGRTLEVGGVPGAPVLGRVEFDVFEFHDLSEAMSWARQRFEMTPVVEQHIALVRALRFTGPGARRSVLVTGAGVRLFPHPDAEPLAVRLDATPTVLASLASWLSGAVELEDIHQTEPTHAPSWRDVLDAFSPHATLCEVSLGRGVHHVVLSDTGCTIRDDCDDEPRTTNLDDAMAVLLAGGH